MNKAYDNFTDAALMGKDWNMHPEKLYAAFLQTFRYQNERIRDLIPFEPFVTKLNEHTKGEFKKGFFPAIQQIVQEPLFRPQCEDPGVSGQPPRPTEESVIHYAGNRDGDRNQDGSAGSYLAYLWSMGRRTKFFESVDPSVNQRQAPVRDELIACINASEQLVKFNARKSRSRNKTLGGDVLDNLCVMLCLLDDGGALEIGHVRQHLFTRDFSSTDYVRFLAHKYQRHVLHLETGSGQAASDRAKHEHAARITPECWFALKGLLLGPGGILHEKAQQGMILPPSRGPSPEAQMFDGMSNAENPSTTLDSQATMTSNVPARGKGPPVLEPATPAVSRAPDRKEAILVPERLGLAGSGARPADLTVSRGETVAVESKVTLNPVVVVGVIAVGLLLFLNRP